MKWVLAILLALWASAAAAAPVKVMILDGASAATYHDWKRTSQVMKRELDETGLFAVTVVSAPPADGDFSAFHPDFAAYQAIVLNYDAQGWPAPLKAAFEAYVKNGGGLVVVHAADNAFPERQADIGQRARCGWAAWPAQAFPGRGARAAASHPAWTAAGLDACRG
jgi:hypothetical protein